MRLSSHKIQSPHAGDLRRLSNKLGAASAFRSAASKKQIRGWKRAGHLPAGATTLIVSLGIISKPKALVIIEAAVVLLVAQALVINRLAGLPYPLWKFHALDV